LPGAVKSLAVDGQQRGVTQGPHGAGTGSQLTGLGVALENRTTKTKCENAPI
jgi:hypothetical protein